MCIRDRDGIEETLTYCDFPSEHWTRIRTNNEERRRLAEKVEADFFQKRADVDVYKRQWISW